ncbi:hypothetical protein ACFL45_02950 [Candidatus Neomarinimicrobiota bacterium]
MRTFLKRMTKLHCLILFLWLGILPFTLQAQVGDDYKKYTSINQLGVALTNFGVLGNGWNRIDGEIQPSCMYKQHTLVMREQVEHFSFSGVWFGGMVGGQPRVSTAIVDGVFEAGSEGFEFIPMSILTERSNVTTSPVYDPDAVSHQDFTTRFTDIFPDDNPAWPAVPNHTELGIEVTMRTYAWDFSFAEAFVMFEYTITNVNPTETISNIYAGIWADVSIANMNYTSIYEPGGGFTWYDNLNGYDQTVDAAGFPRNMGYSYDADGDDGWAETYLAIKTLGGSVPQPYLKTYYSQWPWNAANNETYPEYIMALTDAERYAQLSSSVPPGPRADPYLPADGYPANPGSWLFLHSAGPLGSAPLEGDLTNWELPPGDSLKVVFAMVATRWATGGGDSPERRAELHTNADWAQKAYDGEDVNRNNVLDPGEDTDKDGQLDRYILPEPPPPPMIYIDNRSQQVDIYWDRYSEDVEDPISHRKDFEGYRLYSARKVQSDDQEAEFSLLAEYDLPGNNIGFDVGFEPVRLVNEMGEPDSTFIAGRYYHYRFTNYGVKNGWLNYYAVTAFDQGDPATNLASLESSKSTNRTVVYPGTVAEDWTDKTGVYPNPYRGSASWDGYGTRDKLIWFQYLPPKAEIRIYTLAMDEVQKIIHDAGSYSGEDVSQINAKLNPKFSGGEHAWDLITHHEQEAATGLYLYTVKNIDKDSPNYGKVKEGKFVILK